MSRVFIGGLLCRHDVLADLNYTFFSTPSSQANTALPRVQGEQKHMFTISYTVGIDYLAWVKTPSILRHIYQAGYSKDSEATSQEPIKIHFFLWDVQVLSTPNPLS